MGGIRACGFCRYFVQGGGPTPQGECRREVPQFGGSWAGSAFPDVTADSWCGEFRVSGAAAAAVRRSWWSRLWAA
jgi:hypothetical protein